MRKIRNGKGELGKRIDSLKKKRIKLRKNLQKSDKKEIIIDLAQPHESIELQKARCEAQSQDVGNSGIGINADSELQREEDNLGEAAE